MAWCPKCRNEYVDGITECSECKCELVDELEEIKEVKYLYLKDGSDFDEIINYLHKTGIESAEHAELDVDGKKTDVIGVSPKEYTDASINLSVYFEQEIDDNEYNLTDEESLSDELDNSSFQSFDSALDNENESYDDSKQDSDMNVEIDNDSEQNRISTYGNSFYTTYQERYEEEKSSAYTLLFVGTLGGLALILELAKVYQFPIAKETKWLFYLVFGLMMGGFIIYGYISYTKSISLLKEAEVENKLINDINQWSKDNLTVEYIDSHIDTDTQEELLYFNRMDYIKDSLMHQFEHADEPLIDRLKENIYSNLYDEDDEVEYE